MQDLWRLVWNIYFGWRNVVSEQQLFRGLQFYEMGLLKFEKAGEANTINRVLWVEWK